MRQRDQASSVRLADADTRADLATYAGRARALDDAGAMRMQAAGTALACYVGVLPGSGLMGEGAVIGLRVLPLAEPATVDVTVALAALGDRLARRIGVAGSVAERLDLPPATVHAGWAAVAPPRSGWEPAGHLPGAVLEQTAREGIAEVATGAGTTSGGHAVTALREAVWSRPVEAAGPAAGVMVRSGAAFAAQVLGFLAPDAGALDVRLFRAGRWLRLSTPTGHVLVR